MNLRKQKTQIINDNFFEDNINVCKTDEDLNNLYEKHKDIDNYFLWHGGLVESRKKIESLWAQYKDYAPREFKAEAQKNNKYLSRLWEMLVGVSLLQNNIKLMPNTKDKFPDFDIAINNKNIIIECVSIQNTESDKDRNRVPNIEEIIDENNTLDVPNQEVSLRITTALKNKTDCLKDKNKKYIEGKPYVIALDTSIFSHYQPSDGKLIHDILYGIGDYQLTYQREGVSAQVIDQGYTQSENISKFINVKCSLNPIDCIYNTFKRLEGKDTTLINIGHFTKKEYDYISGIILLNTGIHSININSISDSFIFIKNNRAKYPIDSELSFIPKYIEPTYRIF